MFMEINPAYLIALLFFITSGSYIVLSVVTYTGNIETVQQRDYLMTGAYLALFSLCYGIMTIVNNELMFKVFWGIGFTAGLLFYPGWILFLSNKAYPGNKRVRYMIVGLHLLTILVTTLCILSNEIIMVQTRFGNQFSYYGSTIFKIAFGYLILINLLLVFFKYKWWRNAEMARYSKEAFGFILFALLSSPIGIMTDVIIPIFTETTFVPLGSVFVLGACIPTYMSMRKNKTLSIEVKNVSGHIFKSVNLPILVLDHKNIIRLENESSLEFFGRSINGVSITDVILIDGNKPKHSFFNDNLANEIISAKTKDSQRICEMLLTVEKDMYGDALCKVLVINDLTELLQTLEQANDANRAKSDFISSVGKRTRMPINSIISVIESIKHDYELPREVERDLNSLLGSCDLLIGITNDITDFSKIEADRLEILPVDYSLDSMINDSIRLNTLRIDGRQIDFELQIDEDIPRKLRGDAQRIKQILDILLSNAFKYTDEGKVTLSVFHEPGKSTTGVTLVLSVRDTGIGMSKEQLTELFADYSIINMKAFSESTGSGLGIAITRSLVNLMDGELRVESEPGIGTFMLVRLPQERAGAG